MPGATDEKNDVPTSFTLKNASGTFEGRSSSIFGCLEDLEQKHLINERNRTDSEEYANLNPVVIDDFVLNSHTVGGHSSRSTARDRGGQSDDRRDRSRSILDEDKMAGGRRPDSGADCFRAPRGRAPLSSGRQGGRGREQVPDHGNHPQGWTHYNLDDVSQSDMSEKSNTRAALAFLDERRQLREQQQDEEKFDAGSGACSKGLFSFAKRSKNTAADSEKSEHMPQTKGSDEVEDSKKETDCVSEAVETEDKNDDDNDDGNAEDIVKKSTHTSCEDKLSAVSAISQSFKSRKGIRRNIRSREDDSGDD